MEKMMTYFGLGPFE